MIHHALASKCRPVKDFLLSCEGHVGGTAADNRLFVGAVLYRYHASIPWRNLPVHFGDKKNVHWRLCLWCESAVIERIFRHLRTNMKAGNSFYHFYVLMSEVADFA
ncbi:hypothetical protein NBRC106471_0165 [Acetobacter pasteurianus subsp. pasteurianus LMG 1262 = NBRC 106471]|nr:hypothetical protein NBRC106471_0165 [Acetobacter pasteurianus subsp. pasteurianus LMG 1262 = NBRC 106471]